MVGAKEEKQTKKKLLFWQTFFFLHFMSPIIFSLLKETIRYSVKGLQIPDMILSARYLKHVNSRTSEAGLDVAKKLGSLPTWAGRGFLLN